MRIIVITLAILLAGCSNYDSCFDKNYDSFYEAHSGEMKYVTVTEKEADDPEQARRIANAMDEPVRYTAYRYVEWEEGKRKWEAQRWASYQCRNIQ